MPEEEERMSDERERDSSEKQPEAEERSAGKVKVVYRGPSGSFRDGNVTLTPDEPKEMARERLEHLQQVFEEHTFEEVR
jgi:hypothetical protein